jgi:hypothetical protein
MNRTIAGLGLGVLAMLGACATEPHPTKRPLTSAHISHIAAAPVTIVENNHGLQKSWYMQDSSAAGAQGGLIGALVVAAIDAIANAGPARAAQQTADEIAEVAPAEQLNQSFVLALATAKAAAQTPVGVSYGNTGTLQPIGNPGPIHDALEVRIEYLLSEDATTFRVTGQASYQSPSLQYATPYQFKSAPPKTETLGPVYRNTFVYESERFPLPVLGPELKARLVEAVNTNYRTASGAGPAEGTEDFKKMTKELQEAQDDKLSKSEASLFLAREWTRDGGGILTSEVDAAHAFIAKYLLIDLNDTTVPSLTGTDTLVEESADARTVRMIGSGVAAGSYVSSPGKLETATTYGNARASAKVHSERVKTLTAAAKSRQAPASTSGK